MGFVLCLLDLWCESYWISKIYELQVFMLLLFYFGCSNGTKHTSTNMPIYKKKYSIFDEFFYLIFMVLYDNWLKNISDEFF